MSAAVLATVVLGLVAAPGALGLAATQTQGPSAITAAYYSYGHATLAFKVYVGGKLVPAVDYKIRITLHYMMQAYSLIKYTNLYGKVTVYYHWNGCMAYWVAYNSHLTWVGSGHIYRMMFGVTYYLPPLA